MVILDTNVLSELMKPNPDARVSAWIGRQPADEVFTTAITQAEILRGIAILPEGRRRAPGEAARLMFAEDFENRALAFDTDAVPDYVRFWADRKRTGKPVTPFDATIGAIALSHGAVLATRNTADFAGSGVKLVNPWE